MKKDTAQAVFELVHGITDQLHNSIYLVMESSAEEDIDLYKKDIAQILSDIYSKIMIPILDECPELTPESLKPSA